MRVTTYRWSVGVFCLVIGALMLVEPHQFGAPSYAALQPHLVLWGIGFFAVGATLIVVTALEPPAVISAAGHIVVAIFLLFLAEGFGQVGTWTGVASYAVLGLGAIAAFVIPRWSKGRPPARGLLLAFLVGVTGSVIGLLMLLVPGQFGSISYASIRPQLVLFGAAFLVSGVALAIAQVRPPRSLSVLRAIHGFAALVFLAFMVDVSFPFHNWTGIAYYGGFGLVIGLNPWLSARIGTIDPASLRIRSALALVAIAAVPLLAAIAVIADQGEQIAIAEALNQQQSLAVGLAQNVSDYIGLHRAAAAALAQEPGLLSLSAEAQRRRLVGLKSLYPEVIAFSTFDLAGRPIARSDDLSPVSAVGAPLYEDAKRTLTPSRAVLISTLTHRPVFSFGAPILNGQGQFDGLVAEAIDSARLTERILRTPAGQDVLAYLVDARGHVIAHPNATLVASFADLASNPPVAALLSSNGVPGAVTFSPPDGERLGGYAWIADLGWGIVVERPAVSALPRVRAAREVAFDLLLAFSILAIAFALVVTRRLSDPLEVLAAAVDRLASGDQTAPLPHSQLTEIARLADSFGVTRDRLALRTAERDRAEKDLRRSESHLRQLMDGLPIAIFVMDAAARPFYVNTMAKQLLGRGFVPGAESDTLSEHYGLYQAGTDRLYPTDQLPAIRALVGESVRLDDIEIRHPDRTISLETWGSPIGDDEGAVQFGMAAFLDVTERKRADNTLRFLATVGSVLHASLDYEATLRSLADLIVPRLADWCVIDIVGDDQSIRVLTVTHADPGKAAWARELHTRFRPRSAANPGVPEVVRTGRSLFFSDIPDAALVALARDDADLASLRNVGFTSSMIVPIVAHGRTLGAITLTTAESKHHFTADDLRIAEDLGKRAGVAVENARLYQETQAAERLARQAEESVRSFNVELERRVAERTAQLEGANREMESFSYSVAHDLRAPLRAMDGFSRRLIEDHLEILPDDARHYLDRIRRNAQLMSQLIDDLLNLSRVSRKDLAIRSVDPSSIVGQVVDDLRNEYADRQIQVTVTSLPQCQADAGLLKQIYINLLGNAFKFTRQRALAEIEVGSTSENGETVYYVRDNGAGFDMSYVGKLFGVFQRLHRSDEYEGTGVGLAIVDRIVRRHGGRIWADAAIDRGATFYFTLQARQLS